MVGQVASAVALKPAKSPLSPKPSSPRKQAFVARELDPLLANLSPAATLEALKTSNAVDGSAGKVHSVLTDSIAHVSPSERALGIRAAVAAKKLREWHAEVATWPWPSAQFEPPSLQVSSHIRRSHGGSIDQVLAATQFVEDRYDMTYWGSLPSKTVQEYEHRLEEIQDGLEALELEELKNYIRKAHLLNSRGSEASLDTLYSTDSSSSAYNRLDDFTVVITATIMQALPFLSRLSGSIELWQTRLLVLRQVPVFLHQLEDAQMAMASAEAAVAGGADAELTRDAYHTMKDVLGSRTAALAQTLDSMLDTLEERPDTIPDQWIDNMETVERQYQNWVVEAEQVVMANELNELRSVSIASQSSDCMCPSQVQESLGRRAGESADTGSQSDVTAVEEEEQTSRQGDADEKLRKEPPATIDLSNLSGWAQAEAIKKKAAEKTNRRSSVSYSDISEEPEVIQTAQVHYVCVPPSVTSPGVKPSLIEISSRSSKHSSRGSAHSDGSNSPPLTGSGSDSASMRRNNYSRGNDSKGEENGVSGPPAVFAPWPPSGVSGTRENRSRTTTINVQESWFEESDSEAEGGLRSYGTSSPLPKTGQVSARGLTHMRSNSQFEKPHSGPPVSVDDFFSAIVQPLSGPPTPGSRPVSSHLSDHSISGSKPTVPSRRSSKQPKSRKNKSSRAVSPTNQNLEAQLNSRISNLLSKIPAPIRFFTSSESPASQPGNDTADLDLSKSPVLTAPLTNDSSYSATSSLNLAPEQPHSRHTAASSSRSTQSEVKLYHLHQPGRAQPIKLFVRLVGEGGERVMVRVGGGWSDLGEYLHEYAAHHGRHATVDAGGADFELKDFSVPHMGSSWNAGKSRGPNQGANSRSASLNAAKESASPQNELPNHSPVYAGRARRYVSAGASSTPDAADSPGFVSSSKITGSGQIQVAKSRLSTGASPRSGVVTPPNHHDSEAFALGPAGPSGKHKNISPKKKAWVEGVMNEARKVSGGGTKLIRVDDFTGEGEVPSSWTEGSTRRVHLKMSKGKMKGKEQRE